MTLHIGIDEAGYGPNLGPLVIAATVWDVPDELEMESLWDCLRPVVSQTATRDPQSFHVADSKEVHSAAQGIGNLERSVQVLLKAWTEVSADWHELCNRLDPEFSRETGEPWFDTGTLELPLISGVNFEVCWNRFHELLLVNKIRCLGIASRIVMTREFNRDVEKFGSKGIVLSRNTLGLLSRLWQPDEVATIVCDKHGGRNRYDELLSEICGDAFIFRLEEGRERSRYRVGNSEIRFQMKAEQHFPVAAASLIAKYIRETAMEQFNRFWEREVPGIKPTKGYPQDAKRFLAEVDSRREELGIPESVFWRSR